MFSCSSFILSLPCPVVQCLFSHGVKRYRLTTGCGYHPFFVIDFSISCLRLFVENMFSTFLTPSMSIRYILVHPFTVLKYSFQPLKSCSGLPRHADFTTWIIIILKQQLLKKNIKFGSILKN